MGGPVMQSIRYSRHALRRTARAKARELNLSLQAAPIDQRVAWKREHAVPPWVNGFRVESTARGPFGWRVAAVEDHVRVEGRR